MIVPVFFLAFVAFLVEAQYPTTRTATPTTTEYAYPQPSNSKPEYGGQNPTDYQPSQGPSYYKPSNSKPSYGNSGPATKGYSKGSGDGSYKAQDDLYSRYPSSPIRNLRQEVADAEARVDSIERTNTIYNSNLDNIEEKINKSTAYRLEFEARIYPQLVASIEAQDKKIEQYKAQLRDLSVRIEQAVQKLLDEIIFLTNRLATTRSRQVKLWDQVNTLEANNSAENLAIVAVEDQADGNDQIIEIIKSTRARNLAKYYDNLKDLEGVVAIANEERGNVHTVTLTAENSSQRVEYDQPFDRKPQVAQSIIGIEIDNTQGDYKADEVIYPRVTVEGDERGVTVSLVDGSVGWIVRKIRVRVLSFFINNERSRQQNQTTRAYGDASTQKPSQNTTTTKAYGDASTQSTSRGTTTKAYVDEA